MRKDLKKTGIFALIVFFFLAFVVFEINRFQKEVEVKETKNRIVQIEAEKINRIEIDNFVFEKIGFSWKALEGSFSDLIKKDLVEDWLSISTGRDGRALSEADEEVSWVKFGFTDKSKKVLLKSDEQEVEITLSNRKAFDGGSYLKVKAGKENPLLYSSGEEWYTFFNKDLNLLREQEAFNWLSVDPKASIVSIKASKKSQKSSLGLSLKDNSWASKDADYKDWSFDTAKVSTFIDDLKTFKIKKFVSERPSGLVDYGTLSVKTNESEQYSLKVFKKSQTYYAETSFRPGVFFSLGEDNVETFFPEAYNLRSFDDALSFNQDEVQTLSYKKGSKTLSLSKKDDGMWRLLGKTPQGKEFNGASVLKLFSLMKNVKAERYFVRKPYLSGEPYLNILRKNSKGKYVGFRIYKKVYSCVEGESATDCYVLTSKGKMLAVKKEATQVFFDIDFYKDKVADEVKEEAPDVKKEKPVEKKVKETVEEVVKEIEPEKETEPDKPLVGVGSVEETKEEVSE